MKTLRGKKVTMPHPYIVYGVGRCGTSFTGGTLHNRLGISMGEYFIPPIAGFTDNGSYECGKLFEITAEFSRGETSLVEFHGKLSDYILKREAENDLWGFKDMGSIMSFGYFTFFEDPRLIICTRDERLVVESQKRMRKYRGHTNDDENTRFINQRMTFDRRIRKRINPDHYLLIDFPERRFVEEDEIVEMVKKRWPDDFKS